MDGFPRYWKDERSGTLRPVVEAYLQGKPLSAKQCATMRAYLRQWIMAPVWVGPDLAELRAAVDGLTERAAIARWIAAAEALGIDPL